MLKRGTIVQWLVLLTVVALSGVLYSLVVYGERPLIGAIFSLSICMPLVALERRMIFPRFYNWLHGLSTPAYLAMSLLVYYVTIFIGFAAAGAFLKSAGIIREPWIKTLILPWEVVVYSFAVGSGINFVLRVRELLGRDIFVSLLTGRYRKPVREERVFLFIDLVGSTSFAEKYGDLRTQQYLGTLFNVLAEPVRRHDGAIDDYIGDAVIITWPLKRGLRDARCVRCVFDIITEIEKRSALWLGTFGQMPRLRAALHGGEIITAEIGVDHHKIAYFGDTVNTTARLESLCRTLGHPVLISQELATRMTLPDDIRAEYLGDHAVRGRGQPLGVMALTSMRQTQPSNILPLARPAE
ncbi:MAG: adenylate/guanylate cyclase domain-containing protein [Rhizobiales bacterium]|nr:adenylate/guanylate cyclase domain-containing protein [Hyphomicrobiales bacterium]